MGRYGNIPEHVGNHQKIWEHVGRYGKIAGKSMEIGFYSDNT